MDTMLQSSWKFILALPFLSSPFFAQAGIITTVAGGGSGCPEQTNSVGDGCAATDAILLYPTAVVLDSKGNLFISDAGDGLVRRVDAVTGIITTVASVSFPQGLALDSAGNLFVNDFYGYCVRRVDSVTGIMTTVAGRCGIYGYSGDNGPATNATLTSPWGLSIDELGNLYVSDTNNCRIRRIDAVTHIITTFAGNGCSSQIDKPVFGYIRGNASDKVGNVFVADPDNELILRVDAATNAVVTFAGNGVSGHSGDGDPATQASLVYPNGVGLDPDNNLFIADTDSEYLRRVDHVTGIITTIAGDGIDYTASGTNNGDNGPAMNASLAYPVAVTSDIFGNLFIAEYHSGRVREIRSSHVTISGTPQTKSGLGSANIGSQSPYSDPNYASWQQSIAEPVSTGNGNYYYEHTDFSVAARGLPLVFQRSYNALDSYSGPLGANWNHSFNVSLAQTAPGVENIRWGDGHGETYTLTNGTYVPQAGVFNTLTANADGTYTLTKKDRTQYNFLSSGTLAAIQDKNGNALTLVYDDSGNLVTITAPGGRSLTLAYDALGHIASVTDPMGRTESYSYDGSNNLVSATDPLGGVTRYAYDSAHHVTQITLPNGNVLLQNAYDSQGRAISQTNGRGFIWQFAYNAPAQGQTTITDARGATTIHTYDNLLRIIGTTDAFGHSTSYAYDANNDRTNVTNQNGNTTKFAYDTNGNVLSVTDPLSNQTAFTYDANNDLVTVTNSKGKTTNFSYDSRGNLTGIQDALGDKTTLTHNSFGELTRRTDAKGNTTSFSYSGAGDLAGIRDALGNSTTLAYDGDGRLTSVMDPNSHTATSAYDALGRLTTVSDALGDQTAFAYDGVENLLSVTDANGHTTNYAYDAVNNLLAVTDALGHVTKYSYDADNNRIGFTNAKGNSTTYQYDSLNRLIGTVDPLSFATAYGYDPVGNVVSVTDAKGQTNRFAYDPLSRLLSISYADGKNVAYSYDADGNRRSMTDWTGTTSYTYDALDRVISVTFPGNKSIGYSYDANGHRTSLTYPDSKIVEYGYDADERLSTVTDWLAHITRYAYDPAGNFISAQYPNNAGIRFAYDAANRLTSVVNNTVGAPPLAFNYTLDSVGNRTLVTEGGIPTRYGYDALNKLTSAETWFLKTAWTYDPVGNRLSEASPFGVTNYTYDASDRLLKAGTRTFTYDADGNQLSVTDGLIHWRRTYTWNAANRLVSVDGGVTDSFVYDGDGNRVSQSAGRSMQSYSNDVAAALPVVLQDDYSAGPPSSYVYGLSLIESLQDRDNDFYQYDGVGSVIQQTDAFGIPELSYFYDAWGNSILPAPPSNPFRFAGQAFDSAAGLYYMRARYYDPISGRFMSKDSFSGSDLVPLSGNRFIYSLNRPTVLVDPTGFAAEMPPASTFSPIENLQPVLGSSNSTVTVAQTASSGPSSSSLIDSVIETGCSVVGVFQTIFEKTSDFLAAGAVSYIASGGGTQQVSNVPCYSNLPGVGLFFTSVPTAH